MTGAFLNSARSAIAEQSAPALAWLAPVRAHAASSFLAAGVPTRRVERWKYTELKTVAGKSYDFLLEPGSVEIDEIDALLNRDCTALLVLIDGELDALHSRREDLPLGLGVYTLSEALSRLPERIRPLLEQEFNAPDESMASLNAALMRGGFVIDLGKNLMMEPTIEVLHLTSNRAEPLAINTRGIVLAAAGARAKVVEHFGHIGGGNLLNSVTQLELGEDSQLHFVRLQDLCSRGQVISRLDAKVAASARLDFSQVDLGGELARLDTRVALAGIAAQVHARGLTALKGRAHVDHQFEIIHAARDTRSTQQFRAIADGRSRSVFAGKVIVQPGADGADAQQSTRNLLLSAHAEIDAKPELEIYADEVKCSHGATVGQLDEAALFYLRSRGIDAASARAMLLQAFVEELLAGIASPSISAPLQERFAQRFLA